MNRLITALGLAALCSSSSAALVTLDFEDLSAFRDASGQIFTSNAVHGGFRFSPNCHIDAVPGGSPGAFVRGYLGSSWIGVDTSGCSSAYNASFLGPDAYKAPNGTRGFAAALYVDHFGSPFDLESVYMNFMGVRVLTSKGGTYTAPIPQPPAGYPIVTFNSPLFENVEWIIFFDVGMGAPVGIDNLTLQIPEPGAGMLLPLGLAALVAARRRKSIAS